MKKIIPIIMIGLLFIGVNAFAEGDLIVNGVLGVGTSTPLNKLHVNAGNDSKAIRAEIDISDLQFTTNIAAYYLATASQTGISGGRFIGFNGNTQLTGDGTIYTLGGAENVVALQSSTGPSTIGRAFGNLVTLRRGSANIMDQTITDYFGFYSSTNIAGSGNISGTDWRHAYFENFPNFGGTVDEVSGLWIDKQDYGTTNYGIVLNGDGAGADIVFGASQEARIYSSGGELFAQDGASNITQISPHDPETGEWVFYSKNIKTGRVVHINMEKLVRAVEELTGESFMVETLMEEE